MKTVNILKRIKDKEIEELKTLIHNLEKEQSNFVLQIELVKQNIAKEIDFAKDKTELASSLLDFVDQKNAKCRDLQQHIDSLQVKIESEKQNLIYAYQEHKKFEIAEEIMLKKATQKQLKLESQELDNIGIRNFNYRDN